MTSGTIPTDSATDAAAGVLAAARTERAAADRAGTRMLHLAVEWAAHALGGLDRGGGDVPAGLLR